MSNRLAAWILVTFVLVQAAVHWQLKVAGPLLVDEVAYHFMVRAVADGHPCEVANGYREYQSPALEVRLTHTVTACEGRLVSKYPYLAPWLAAPLYPLLGFSSLIAINLLAHAIVLGITWWLAKRYLGSPGWALCAPACLELCTYFWEYAEGAWPHSLAMAFTMGAFACAVASLTAGGERARRQLLWAAASGLLIGLGAGARLDAAFWLLIVGCLFALPLRPRLLLAMGAGASVGVLLLALDNYCKLELFWPFVYNQRNVARLETYFRFVPVAAFSLLLVLAVGASQLRPGREVVRRLAARVSPAGWAGLCAMLLLALLAWPPTRRLLGGVVDLALDLRALDPSRIEPAMSRTASGAVLYIGHYKKALLQSCPQLSALILPLVVMLRAREARRLWPLYVPIVVLLSAFAARSWHGGLSLNMRYLMPALPMLCVLIAWVLRELWPRSRSGWYSAACSIAAIAITYSSTEPPANTLPEARVLTAPLVMAGLLLVACLLHAPSGSGKFARSMRFVAPSLLLTALGWGALTSLAYDYPAQRGLRRYNEQTAASVRARIEPDALVFVPYIDPFGGLIDAERVRIANAFQDDFASFGALARHHLDLGRSVYGVFPLPLWQPVRRHASEAGLRLGRPEVLPTGLVLAGFASKEPAASL
jgi:hypothetical protein